MSPEQADPTVPEIDTRTDIYSLGVLLYELVAGSLPFETKAAAASAVQEMQRRVLQEQLQRPNARASEGSATSICAADARTTNPCDSRRTLRGDRDWIAMKALEKDRTRRYQSASELAADVERHLRHEPVLAGPPGTCYRVRPRSRSCAALRAPRIR